jgi:hypothetical protein
MIRGEIISRANTRRECPRNGFNRIANAIAEIVGMAAMSLLLNELVGGGSTGGIVISGMLPPHIILTMAADPGLRSTSDTGLDLP